jgi:hypothetical protein
MNVYFISGLGADERAFYKIRIPDRFQTHYLDWIDHYDGESFGDYACRFAERINTAQPFCLVGLSFGGMLAIEISRIVVPEKIILVSSITTCYEMPWYMRIARALHLDKVVPAGLLNKVYPFTDWFFGTLTKDEKALIRDIIQKAKPAFLRWAIAQIIHWKNTKRPVHLVHIHGAADRVFPFRYVHADIPIPLGGHFMIYHESASVSHALTQALEDI